MEPFGVNATLLAVILASSLAYRAFKRKSLTSGGSYAAFVVAFLLVGTGLRGLNLLTFYFISIKATKYKKEYKAKIDGTIFSNAGSTTRDIHQVLACSLLATVLSLVHAFYCGSERAIFFHSNIQIESSGNDVVFLSSQLTCGILAHHSTCLADTLASEIGILSNSSPRLITQPWKRVPSGTNGGVTLAGFFWSAMGGIFIGISTVFLDFISGIGLSVLYASRIIMYSLTCGLLGSTLDSILGATAQQSYFDKDSKMVYQEQDRRPKSTVLVVASCNLLTNEQVNILSVVITTFLGGWVLGPLFFGSTALDIIESERTLK